MGAVTLAFIVSLSAIALFNRIAPFFRGWHDEGNRLAQLLNSVSKARRPRGSIVIRVRDKNWKSTVVDCTKSVDVALIDLSEINENITWELETLSKCLRPVQVVILLSESASLHETHMRSVNFIVDQHFPEFKPSFFLYADSKSSVGQYSFREFLKLKRFLLDQLRLRKLEAA